MLAEVIKGRRGCILSRAKRGTLYTLSYTHEHGQPGRVRIPLRDFNRPEATLLLLLFAIEQNKKTKKQKKSETERERENRAFHCRFLRLLCACYFYNRRCQSCGRGKKNGMAEPRGVLLRDERATYIHAPAVVTVVWRIRPRGVVNADAAVTTAEKNKTKETLMKDKKKKTIINSNNKKKK